MSIRGIGPVAATAMIVDMPERGTMMPKEAASRAFLAAVSCRSPAVGALEEQGPHLRRPRRAAHHTFHADRNRDPIQRPAQEHLPCALRTRKALDGRHHGSDAQAHRPRQRPDPGSLNMPP